MEKILEEIEFNQEFCEDFNEIANGWDYPSLSFVDDIKRQRIKLFTKNKDSMEDHPVFRFILFVWTICIVCFSGLLLSGFQQSIVNKDIIWIIITFMAIPLVFMLGGIFFKDAFIEYFIYNKKGQRKNILKRFDFDTHDIDIIGYSVDRRGKHDHYFLIFKIGDKTYACESDNLILLDRAQTCYGKGLSYFKLIRMKIDCGRKGTKYKYKILGYN